MKLSDSLIGISVILVLIAIINPICGYGFDDEDTLHGLLSR